jgi:hypothetical protein
MQKTRNATKSNQLAIARGAEERMGMTRP